MNRLFGSERLRLAGVLAFIAAALALLFYGISDERRTMQILPSAEVRLDTLDDPGAHLAWPAVLDQPADAWRPRTSDYYIQAFDGGAVWVRATLRNPSARTLTGVFADEELILDHLDCWTPDAEAPGGWARQSTGERVPPALKPIWGRDAVHVTVPAGGETVVYLRARDKFGVWFAPCGGPRPAPSTPRRCATCSPRASTSASCSPC